MMAGAVRQKLKKGVDQSKFSLPESKLHCSSFKGDNRHGAGSCSPQRLAIFIPSEKRNKGGYHLDHVGTKGGVLIYASENSLDPVGFSASNCRNDSGIDCSHTGLATLGMPDDVTINSIVSIGDDLNKARIYNSLDYTVSDTRVSENNSVNVSVTIGSGDQKPEGKAKLCPKKCAAENPSRSFQQVESASKICNTKVKDNLAEGKQSCIKETDCFSKEKIACNNCAFPTKSINSSNVTSPVSKCLHSTTSESKDNAVLKQSPSRERFSACSPHQSAMINKSVQTSLISERKADEGAQTEPYFLPAFVNSPKVKMSGSRKKYFSPPEPVTATDIWKEAMLMMYNMERVKKNLFTTLLSGDVESDVTNEEVINGHFDVPLGLDISSDGDLDVTSESFRMLPVHKKKRAMRDQAENVEISPQNTEKIYQKYFNNEDLSGFQENFSELLLAPISGNPCHAQHGSQKLSTPMSSPLCCDSRSPDEISDFEMDEITRLHTICNGQKITEHFSGLGFPMLGHISVFPPPRKPSHLHWKEDLVQKSSPLSPPKVLPTKLKPILHQRSKDFVYPYNGDEPSPVVITRTRTTNAMLESPLEFS